jgi:quercetin dioxygenase-like cupin family protein
MKQGIRILIVACGFLASIEAMSSPAAQAQAPAQNAPAAKQLFQTDLNGVPGQEALVFLVEFAPGQGLPWHVHPGGHELVYGLEGTFAFEEQNGTKSSLKTGEVKHIGPNIGHTVRNEGTTVAKVLVVRVKDKAKPIATPFQR